MTQRSRRAPLRLDSLEDRTVPTAGDLDLSFSGDGLATAGLSSRYLSGEQGWDQVVQPDGKLLVVGNVAATPFDGDFAVYRYLPDGTLDPAFGVGGVATVDFGAPGEQAFGIALQADGKIVIVGDTEVAAGGYTAFAVARLTTGGQLDPTFSGDGKVTTTILMNGNLPRPASAWAVTVQPDQKVVVAGYTFTAADEEFAVARYLPDGSLDSAFGTQGVTSFGTFAGDSGHAVAVQPDGKIVVGGFSFVSTNPDFSLARLNSNGTLDTTFGTNGIVVDTYPGGNQEAIYSLAVYPDGRILAAGEMIPTDFYRDFALARYLPDGAPDPTFGIDYDGNGTKDGKLNTEVGFSPFGGETSEIANAVAVQADGKIVAGGEWYAPDDGQTGFAVARYLDDGTLDPTFGRLADTDNNPGTPDVPTGKQVVEFGSGFDRGMGLSLATIGGVPKIYLSGQTDNNQGDVGVARLNADGTLDPAFGTGGRVSTNYLDVALPNDDLAHAVVVQADGKVVVAGQSGQDGRGDFALARFNRDGTPDPTFGNQGAVLNAQSAFAGIRVLALQPDGKIVAAADSSDDFLLSRYTADGHLDTSFDDDGVLWTYMNTNGPAGATAVALQPDGKIVAAGYVNDGNNFALTRYLPNGRLDMTFDFDGRLIDYGAGGAPVGMAVDGAGRILVAGPGLLARYLPGGALDPSFDGDGHLPLALGGDPTITGVAVRPDGKILVIGRAAPLDGGPDGTDAFALAQLLPDGSFDPAFGLNGRVWTDFDGRTDAAAAVRVQPDGKVVLAGTSRTPDDTWYALARYLPDGSLDPTFGTGGKVTGTFGPGTKVEALYLQPGGKINIAGSVTVGSTPDFAVAQFLGDSTNAPPTTPGIADFAVDEDAPPQTFDLRALFDDDSTADADLTFGVQNTNPALVTAAIDANDVLTLTFLPNQHGTATITVRATDGDGAFTDEPFTVTVNSVNDAPVAAGDSATVNTGASVAVNVLANDTDADGDALTVLSFTHPAGGTVVRDGANLRYTPNAGTVGADSFTYTVSDGHGGTDTATVSLTVTDNVAPAVRQVRLYYGPGRYEVLTDRAPVLGWSRITRIAVVFTLPVQVDQADLTLTGLGGAYSYTGFTYNPATRTATWNLGQTLPIDRLTLRLDGTSPAGVRGQTSGLLLGADLVRRFAVLPGDLDGDGVVTQAEADTVKKNLRKRYPNPRTADVNGDGLVTMADYNTVKFNIGKRV